MNFYTKDSATCNKWKEKEAADNEETLGLARHINGLFYEECAREKQGQIQWRLMFDNLLEKKTYGLNAFNIFFYHIKDYNPMATLE